MPPQESRVYIVDDDPSVRTGLERLLRSGGFRAETFTSAENFLQNAKWIPPLCLVLDVQMEGLSGLEVQELITVNRWDCPIIFLTGHGDIPMSVKAMKNGAHDFFTKPVDDDKLLEAVSQALQKHAESLRSGDANFRGKLNELTDREFEIMRFVIGGALNKQIASHLGIAEKTVKTHRGRVMQKLEVESVAELVRLSIGAGIEPLRV